MFKQWIKDMKKQFTLTAIFSILLGLVLVSSVFLGLGILLFGIGMFE